MRADQLAKAAGLPPIPPDSVTAVGFYPALGLYQRDELVAALTVAMAAVRTELPAAAAPQFDAIFRPRGAWLLDAHDVALATARRKFRDASWEGARPAVEAPGSRACQPAARDRRRSAGALPRGGASRARQRGLRGGARVAWPSAAAASAQMAEAILDGYRDAALWQGQALEFLLSAEWVRTPGGRTSPAALVRAAWGRPDLAVPSHPAPLLRLPDAVPRVATPPSLVARIVAAENWSAEEWARRGAPRPCSRCSAGSTRASAHTPPSRPTARSC